jgi:hypothetical protein
MLREPFSSESAVDTASGETALGVKISRAGALGEAASGAGFSVGTSAAGASETTTGAAGATGATSGLTSATGAGAASGAGSGSTGAKGLAKAVEVLTISIAVGLYSLALGAVAWTDVGRLPRARPAPRVVPNAPDCTVEAAGACCSTAGITAAGAGTGWADAGAGSLGAALEAPV